MGYGYTDQGLSQYGLQAAYAVYGPQVYNHLKRRSEYGIIDVSGPRTSRDARLREHYGGTLTVTEEEEEKRKKMASTEHTRRRWRKGRKKAMLAKKINSVTEPVVARFGACNPYMTTACGYFKLLNNKNTTASTGTYLHPLHMFDITSWLNNVTGNVVRAEIGRQLQFTQVGSPINSIGGAFWTNPVTGLANDGVTLDSGWALEQTGHTNSLGSAPHKRDILEWFDFRMLCYGRTELPTRWKVALVQLTESEYAPQEIWSNGMSVSMFNPVNEFYNALTGPFVNNPIELNNFTALKGKIKYLHSEDFIIPSLSTTDGIAAGIPRVHEIRGFHRLNRIQNYDWDTPTGEPVYANAADTVARNNRWATTLAEYSPYVHPNARIYLLVIAQSRYTEAANDGLFNAAAHPSYDLQMRVKHLVED